MRRLRPHSAAFVALALAACKFSSDGLGDDGASAGGSTAAASEEASGGTTAPGPTTGADGGMSGGATEATEATEPPTTEPPPTEPTTEPPTTGSTTGPPPGCGDGEVDPGEECDDGAGNGADRACTPVCTVNECGDGFALAGVEVCDDGNADLADGCVACQPAVCGDGHVYKNVESCDGAGESADCDADCSLVQCGDMMMNQTAGEVCDLGPLNGMYGSGCNGACDGPGPVCGDGALDSPDEVCDPGIPLPNNQACSPDCKVIGCAAPWENCDGDPNNGCEIDLDNDKNNCGECDKGCTFDCDDGHCSI